MDFRILGPLEVHRDSQLLEVNGERRSLLLAALLLNANQPVHADRLIGWVWPDRPDGARSALHTHVRNLRRLIGTAGGEVLRSSQTHGNQTSYRLVLDPDQLDSLRFARLVAGARKGRHLQTPERSATAERSASALRAALRLWRGQHVLSGLPLPEPLALEAARLQQLRLEALEARIDADLVLDRHADLVEELEQLVSAHPAAERFHALLMLARYRSGQQVAALDTYQRAYRTLGEEYGIQPGPELERLQRRILARDPSLDSPAQAARRLGRPYDLPAEPPQLIGRQSHGDRVRDALAGPAPTEAVTGQVPLVVVHGAAGVGKTALAVWAAHRLRGRFQHGTLFAGLRGAGPGDPGRRDATPGAADPSELLAQFLSALGLEPADIPTSMDARASRFRTLVCDRRVLIVLDDAADEAQVRPLLPGTAGCAVLVTSRRPLHALPATNRVTLGPLNLEDAVELLGAAVDPVEGAARVRRDHGAARTVAELCDRLPLALRIAGGKLAARPSWTLQTLAARLSERRLMELTLGDLSVRATLAASYATLTDQQRRALRLLALTRAAPARDWISTDWVTPSTAAALLDCDRSDAADVLDELVEAHLAESRPVEAHPGGYGYRLPGLVADFAAERLESEEAPADRDAAGDRLRVAAH